MLDSREWLVSRYVTCGLCLVFLRCWYSIYIYWVPIYIYILQRFLLNRRMYIKLGLSSLEITSRFFLGQCVRVCVSAVVARAEFAVGSNPRNPIAQPSNFMPNQCAWPTCFGVWQQAFCLAIPMRPTVMLKPAPYRLHLQNPWCLNQNASCQRVPLGQWFRSPR